MSHFQFLNDADDVQWLKDGALRGVELPAQFADFQSFGIRGNEDAPDRLELYTSTEPLFTDDYLQVDFPNNGLIYCEYKVIKY